MESKLKKKRNIVYLRFSFHQPQQNMRHRAVFSLSLSCSLTRLPGSYSSAHNCARAHFYFVAQVRFRSENNFTEMKLLFVCANVSIWMQIVLFLSFVVSFSVSVILSSVCISLMEWPQSILLLYRVIHFGIVSHCLFFFNNLDWLVLSSFPAFPVHVIVVADQN